MRALRPIRVVFYPIQPERSVLPKSGKPPCGSPGAPSLARPGRAAPLLSLQHGFESQGQPAKWWRRQQ